MKAYLAIILSWLLVFTNISFAQTSPGKRVDGTIFTGKNILDTNYVKAPQPYNPSDLNSITTATSSATLTRDTTGGNLFQGLPSYQCDTSANAGYCEFKINTPKEPALTGNCAAYTYIKGDGTLYSLQITDGTTARVSAGLSNALSTGYGIPFVVNYPCQATPTVRITQTTAGTSPAINIGWVGYGIATNIGQGTIDQPLTNAGTITIGATTTAPTKGTVSTDLIQWGRKGDLAIIRGIYKQTAGGAGGSGDYLFTLPNGMRFDSNKVTYFTTVVGASGTFPNSFGIGSATASDTISQAVGFVVPYDATRFRIGLVRANSTSGADRGAISATQFGLGAQASFSFDFFAPIEGQSDTAVITPNQWNYGPRAYTPTFTGFGTVTNVDCTEARQGVYNLIECKFTAGTPTGVEARISLPNSYSSVAYSQGIRTASDGEAPLGVSAAVAWIPLIESSVGYLTVGIQGSTTAGLTKALGSTAVSAGQTVSFKAKVQIQGWTENQNAPQLLGSVTSNSSNAYRSEFATINNNGTCSIVSSSSGFTSTSKTATGQCSTVVSFGVTPTMCSCTGMRASGSTTCTFQNAVSATSMLTLTQASATDSDQNFYVECKIPR